MGKQDIDSELIEDDDIDADDDVEVSIKPEVINHKDMRRLLEERLDEARLNRVLREYDFKDI